MPEFGWTRLAYSLLVLATLGAIIQIGSPDAATRDPDSPGSATAAVRPVDVTEPDFTMDSGGPRDAQVRLAPRREEAPDERAGPARPGAATTRKTPPPVFRRPSPAVGGSVQRRKTERVCGDLQGFPSGSRVLFPLSKAHFGSYEDTWGAPRPQGGHEGTDLMVPTGTPEYAITDGTIVPVAGSNGNGWNTLGGYAVMLEAAYSVGPIRKGDLFYYAHLKRESDLEVGDTVSAGQVLGYAGDTGQGPEITSGLFPPHLHFGWYDTTGARTDLDSGAMNPFPLLEWIEANGGALRGGSEARYCEVPQTGTPRPSNGTDRWPAPKKPGVRPDLSAGSPEPSPVVRKHEVRKHPTGPGKPDAHPSQSESGAPESRNSKPQRGKASPPDPRAGRDPSPTRPESSPADERGEDRPQPPPGGDRPDEDSTDRPGGEKKNQKDRDPATKPPPKNHPPNDDSRKNDPPKDGPDKAPDKDKERDKGSGSPDEPRREPPPSDPEATDETEDAETTTAENGKEPDPEDPAPEESSEDPSEETTAPGG